MSKDDQPEKSVAILACPGMTVLHLVGMHFILEQKPVKDHNSDIISRKITNTV